MQPGDTLFSIAYNHNVSMHLISSINQHIDGVTVFPNDELLIPLKFEAFDELPLCTVAADKKPEEIDELLVESSS